jgi:hypothetical protein
VTSEYIVIKRDGIHVAIMLLLIAPRNVIIIIFVAIQFGRNNAFYSSCNDVYFAYPYVMLLASTMVSAYQCCFVAD